MPDGGLNNTAAMLNCDLPGWRALGQAVLVSSPISFWIAFNTQSSRALRMPTAAARSVQSATASACGLERYAMEKPAREPDFLLA